MIEVIKENTLNASCNNVSMKDANKNQVQLPIYEYVLLKTDGYDIMSLGYHRIAKNGEI